MPKKKMSKGKEEEELEVTEQDVVEEKDEPEEETKDPEELLSRLKYLQAEFENFKKRTAKEMETLLEHSNQRMISCMLPVIDDLERASTSIKNDEDANGVKMIFDNLMETLRNEGLEEIGSVGEEFDPFKHEAVAQVQDDDLENNKIAEVVQKGFSFKSKVIRPSKVVVVKNEPKEGIDDENNRN